MVLLFLFCGRFAFTNSFHVCCSLTMLLDDNMFSVLTVAALEKKKQSAHRKQKIHVINRC